MSGEMQRPARTGPVERRIRVIEDFLGVLPQYAEDELEGRAPVRL